MTLSSFEFFCTFCLVQLKLLEAQLKRTSEERLDRVLVNESTFVPNYNNKQLINGVCEDAQNW